MKRESLNTTARQDSLGVAVMGECQIAVAQHGVDVIYVLFRKSAFTGFCEPQVRAALVMMFICCCETTPSDAEMDKMANAFLTSYKELEQLACMSRRV